MNNVPDELRYTESHEWVRELDDGSVAVGITHHAQDLLGDIVFLELPEVGASFAAGSECAVIESVKAASDIYCPLSGEIVGVNETLSEKPESVNLSPYEDGWIFRLRLDNPQELDELLDAEAYAALIASEAH